MTGYLEFYRMSLLHILQSIISRCVTRWLKIFVCAWIVLLICLKTPETANEKKIHFSGQWVEGLFTCKAQWKMDIKTKTLLFFSSQQIRIFPQCSSWVVSFFHCRFKSHSFFNVSFVCQVPPWGPHLTSSLLIIRCLIDVLYLLLLVLLLVFKGGYTFRPSSSTKCQSNFQFYKN